METLSPKSAKEYAPNSYMEILSPTFVVNHQPVKLDSLQMILPTDVLGYAPFQRGLMENLRQEDVSRNVLKVDLLMTQREDAK